MKLFLRSILFFAVASFAPLALGQTATLWDDSVTTGQVENPFNWSNGTPNATNGEVFSPFSGLTLNVGEISTITIPSLTVVGGGAVLYNISTGNTLTVVGANPSNTSQDILIDQGSSLSFVGGPLGNGTVTLSNGMAIVGDASGSGTLNISAGSLTFANQVSPLGTYLNIGNGAGVTGTLNQTLTSSVTFSGNAMFIGSNGGTGTYTMSDSSSLTTASFVIIGSNSTATDKGTTGELTISGSSQLTINSGGDWQVGTVGRALGAVSIATGTLGGTGTVMQNGAGSTAMVNGFLLVGAWTGATGDYQLSAGTLHIGATGVVAFGTSLDNDPSIGGTGTMEQSGGAFTSSSGATLVIGDTGSGIYTLSGAGNANFAGDVYVGQAFGSTGTVFQMGGTLISSGKFYVGANMGTGEYSMTGGTAAFNNLNLGDPTAGSTGVGTFYYSGTTPTSLTFNNLLIGFAGGGGGIFNQDTSLTVSSPVAVNANGTYNLNGGTLTTGGTLFTGTGNFNFAGGGVTVAGSNWIDPLNGTISGTSTITTTAALGATLSGNLTGGGTLDITGGGTVTLMTGTNNVTDSWGATLTGNSTLSAPSTQSLSTTGTYMIGTGSTLRLGSTANATFNGNISDFSDPLDSGGTDTFNFTGANKLRLAGQTNLSQPNSRTLLSGGGTLEVDNGIISNVNGSAGNAGDTFDVGNGTTTGTVRLLGINTLPITTIDVGSTLLADNITGAPGNVTNSGTLGTLGTLNAPATLTISGSLTSTNTILINANGTIADRFNVNTANLSGVANITSIGTNTYTVVHAAVVGGITSTLTAVSPGVLLTSSLSLDVTHTNLLLTTTQLNFQQATAMGLLPALTPNETAVSGALNPVITKGIPYPPTFAPILAVFDTFSASQIPRALEELTPESLQYARMISFENSNLLAVRMNGVDADLRGGYAGLDSSAISVVSPGFNSGLGRSLGSFFASNTPAYHPSAPNGVNYYPGGAPPQEESAPASSAPQNWDSSTQVISDSTPPNPYMATQNPAGPETPQVSEFIGGDAVLANLNRNQTTTDAPSSKASYTTGDAVAGVSFRMTSHLAMGVLFDYNHTDAKTDSSGSKTEVDSYSPGLFATYFDHGFYVNGLFSFGYNNYANTRNISFLDETAASHARAQQYVGDLDLGYDFHPDKHWVVGPTLGATYTHLNIDSFTESGAPGADLAVASQSADSLRSRLGGHLIYQTYTGDVLLQPNITAMWQHEYLDNSSGITSSFSDFNSNPFTIQTAAPSRDSALIGVGLTATLSSSMALYLNYIADVGASDYFAQSVVGGFKARF